MVDDPDANSSSEEDTNDYFKNPMKRRIHDIQKLNLQNKEMLMMAGHNKKLAQAIIKQKNLTKTIQQNQTKNFANTSLCGCTTTSRFRSAVMQIVFNPWFDKLILVTIFANCICLAIEDPSLEEPDPIIEIFDLIFLAIFSCEMVLKIIAMGFAVEPHSYLRDPWNILDFSVVILGWFSLFASSLNISAIRVIRILRPLRTLNSLQGMRALVLTLLNSLPSVLNILLLFCFTLIIFGTIGVQLFKGLFQGRCVLAGTEDTDEEIYLQNLDGQDLFCQKSKKPQFECPIGYECLVRGNPDVGLVNWDNIFVAVLTQFEMITLEGWSDVMYKVRNAHGGDMTMDIFCIFSVVFGAFFVLNLMIAVQYNFLDEAMNEVALQKEKEKKAAEAEKSGNNMQQELADNIMAQNTLDGDVIEVKKPKKTCKQSFKEKCSCCLFDPSTCCCKCWYETSAKVRRAVTSNKWTLLIVFLILGNSVVLATEHYEQPDWLTETQNQANIFFTVIFACEMLMSMMGLGCKEYFSDGFNIFDFIIVMFSLFDLGVTLSSDGGSAGFITVLRGFRLLRIFKLVKSWTTLQQLLKTIINSMSSISNLAVLSLLFLFVYSLIGKQFFYGEMVDLDGEVTRYHFNSTTDSMITMFIVLSGENWNYVMETVVYAHPDKQYLAVVFFVTAILIGNFMLLNLFLAILLKFLADAVDDVRQKEARQLALKQQELMNDAIKAQQITQKRDEEFHRKIYANEQHPKDLNPSARNIPLKANATPASGETDQAQQDNQVVSPAEINLENIPGSILNGLNQKANIIDAAINENQSNQAAALDVNQNNELGSPPSRPESSTNAVRRGEPGILRQKSAFKGGAAKIKTQKSVLFKNDPDGQEDKESQGQRIDDIASMQSKSMKSGKSSLNDSSQGGIRRQKTDYSINMQQKDIKNTKKKKRLNEIIIDGNSLFCISEKNKIRIALGKFAENPYFEAFVFNLIGINSLFLALDEPTLTMEKNAYTKNTLELMGSLVSILFIGECLLKIIVMGLVKGKHAYLKDNYNILDFMIVCFSILSWVLESMNFGSDIASLKALRALRALRPLKLVSKNEGMKLVVNSILASIPNLINVFLISILFYFVFGVIGTQMLAGRVSFCDLDITLDKIPCLEAGGDWVLPSNNYNTVLYSMTTFFEVSTLETWPDIMFAATNSQEEVDLAPKVASRTWISLLFISFIFVTTFFVMNLFISVIVGQFNEQKEKSEGSATLSDEQKEWVKIQRFMAEVKAPVKDVPPESAFRLKVYHLVRTNAFDYFITGIIMANTITMCMDYQGASDEYLQVLEIFNLIFVVIFTLEAVFKLIGLGPTYYFYIDWNKFDFGVVIMSLISMFDSGSFNLTALRIIRVARLLRMIKSSKELQALLKTLYLAMNNIANVALLFMLIIFTFSVAGMTLFGEITEGHYGMIDKENLNFRTFYMSANVLIRSSTGESWNQIMHDCVYDRGSIAYFYWMIFQLMSFFIFLNVFIAVIYEEFQNVNQVESTLEVLSLKKRDIASFLETWGEFNESGQHYMPTKEFRKFMRKLPAPLGYRGLNIDKSKLDKIIFCLNIRDHEGFVYFPEVMWAIFYSIIGKNDKELHECKPMRNIMRKVKNKYSGLSRNTSLDQLCGNKFYRNDMTVTKYLCGRVILDNLRILRKRRLDRQRDANIEMNEQDTARYLKEESEKHKGKNSINFVSQLCSSFARKPKDMGTFSYKKTKIRVHKGPEGMHVSIMARSQKSIQSK